MSLAFRSLDVARTMCRTTNKLVKHTTVTRNSLLSTYHKAAVNRTHSLLVGTVGNCQQMPESYQNRCRGPSPQLANLVSAVSSKLLAVGKPSRVALETSRLHENKEARGTPQCLLTLVRTWLSQSKATKKPNRAAKETQCLAR